MFTFFAETYPEMINGETVALNGAMSRFYLQARMNVGQTNTQRMERHRQFMHSLIESITEQIAADSSAPVRWYEAALPYMRLSHPFDRFAELSEKTKNCQKRTLTYS